jgi:hypothetical protein
MSPDAGVSSGGARMVESSSWTEEGPLGILPLVGKAFDEEEEEEWEEEEWEEDDDWDDEDDDEEDDEFDEDEGDEEEWEEWEEEDDEVSGKRAPRPKWD